MSGGSLTIRLVGKTFRVSGRRMRLKTSISLWRRVHLSRWVGASGRGKSTLLRIYRGT